MGHIVLMVYLLADLITFAKVWRNVGGPSNGWDLFGAIFLSLCWPLVWLRAIDQAIRLCRSGRKPRIERQPRG